MGTFALRPAGWRLGTLIFQALAILHEIIARWQVSLILPDQ
jgi:hypothetical protein